MAANGERRSSRGRNEGSPNDRRRQGGRREDRGYNDSGHYDRGYYDGRRPAKRRRRRGGIFFRPLAYLLMIAAMLAGISVFFKVSNIIVKGNSRYSSEQIILSSEIEIGESLFFINTFKATSKLFSTLPYIDEAKINRKLPDTIVISVEEAYPLATVCVSGNYYIIDKNCSILEKTDYSGSIGTIAITGIEPILPTVGGKLELQQPDNAKINYLTELLGLILEKELHKSISEIDATSIANITFRYMERFTVELGKHERLEQKLDKLESVLQYISQTETGKILLVNDREPRFIPD
ncbi:MAG: FtsQ-type POTRA domain-containing protein [Clostridiales bacterium]|nr:FtsQ-type POTRA domain-containing protein [Clostridiales bacterium]